MATLYVELGKARYEVGNAVEAIARWRGDPSPIGACEARAALTSLDKVLRYIALARGLLLNEMAEINATDLCVYEDVLRERFNAEASPPGHADRWVYEREEDFADPTTPDTFDGYPVGRAAGTTPA